MGTSLGSYKRLCLQLFVSETSNNDECVLFNNTHQVHFFFTIMKNRIKGKFLNSLVVHD